MISADVFFIYIVIEAHTGLKGLISISRMTSDRSMSDTLDPSQSLFALCPNKVINSVSVTAHEFSY